MNPPGWTHWWCFLFRSVHTNINQFHEWREISWKKLFFFGFWLDKGKEWTGMNWTEIYFRKGRRRKRSKWTTVTGSNTLRTEILFLKKHQRQIWDSLPGNAIDAIWLKLVPGPRKVKQYIQWWSYCSRSLVVLF